LITGGASGIGLLMGRIMLKEGIARLVVWDIREEALKEALRELSGQGYEVAAVAVSGPAVSGFEVDIADLESIRGTLRQMERQSITVDILINNAGIVVGKDFAEHSQKDIDLTMQVNALGPMRLALELLPGMIRRGEGHIVNIASAAGLVSNPKMSVYCASKWALIGWSDSLRIEMEKGRTGVRVTTVEPYYINTGMFGGVRSPLIPILRPEFAARKILSAVKKNRIVLRIPGIVNFLPLMIGILPIRWFDKVVGDWMGIHRSMNDFRGRK